ncbi:MAG: tRNA pseudouridine(38-40) synthase TruA [Saprospiraceae bacterium]|nr:tRNA pseudouridine(38-40) synthase TruA [Saprospiraceae bacterium]
MRYFLLLAYKGTRYAGWQRQKNALSVQEVLETALATILRQPVELTGCGRTDAGVHARRFVAHLDVQGRIPARFLNGLNSLLPADLAVYGIYPVHPEAHARFDANLRSYTYCITFRKDPFLTETAWFYPHQSQLDAQQLSEVAGLLQQYEHFFPFCKSHSGVEHYRCTGLQARWEPAADQLLFHISANRFLRGMVRLIVGASIQVARGQLALDDIRRALDEQTTLKKNWSAPPEGLALTEVKYPYDWETTSKPIH